MSDSDSMSVFGDKESYVKRFALWRLVGGLLVALLIVPLGTASATERGARLAAFGTTTTRIQGREVEAARQLEQVVLSGEDFAPGELIGVWLTMPDGSVMGIDDDDVQAGSDGHFALELGLGAGLPTGLHHFSARGQESGRGAIAEFYLLPGQGPATTAGTQLSLSPAAAKQLDTVELSASGFTANESVALWLTMPDGAVIGLGQVQTDSDGAFSVSLYLSSSLPVGRHYFTGRGNSSGKAAITPFVLQYGNGLNLPGAEIAVNLGAAPQRTVLELSGQGFDANETLSFWLTLPNGIVFDLGEIETDGDGNLDVAIYLAQDLPVGTHYLSFVSNQSQQAGFARLELTPGPQFPGEE